MSDQKYLKTDLCANAKINNELLKFEKQKAICNCVGEIVSRSTYSPYDAKRFCESIFKE